MKNKDRIGKIAVFPGSENHRPYVCYVRGYNGLGLLIIDEINSGVSHMADPEETYLQDYDHKEFKKIHYKWKISDCDVRKKRFKHSLSELEDS